MTSWIDRVSLERPFTSYSKIQIIISMIIRNRRFHINYSKLKHKRYLNIGPGPYSEPTCINLDYSWNPRIDICWDITKGIPLPDQSMDGIFTEHCLEHISLESSDHVLAECKRILRPGGLMRIVVPDGELYLTRYTELIKSDSVQPLPYSQSDKYEGIYCPIMSVNRIFRAHGHKFIYDFETLSLLLQRNGFVDIRKEKFHYGRNPELLFDHESRAVESLYVEACVPL